MLGGVLAMVGLDVAAKWLLASYSLAQLVFLRCLFSVLIIFAVTLARSGLAPLATRHPGWHLARTALMTVSMFSFFAALKHIPLAEVMTIAFAAPLLVTMFSGPFLGERVGPWRWAAVIAGFAGVLVVLRPGGEVLQPAALLALLGAASYAALSLTARRLGATESSAALSLYLFPAPLLAGAAWSLWSWRAPAPVDWLLFVICGLCGGLAFVLMNAGLRRAPAALLVPFEYTGLLWAALAGYWIWDERPGAATWAGAALIVAGGLVIAWRESGRGGRRHGIPLQEATPMAPRRE